MNIKVFGNIYVASSRQLSDSFWSTLAPMGLDKSECITSPQQLDSLSREIPEGTRVFFPHWNWTVPKEIHSVFECVMFHMTDLPIGRGGSPLQNLILSGLDETVVTAFRCEVGLDTGPVYLKTPLSLSGPAHEIFERTDLVIARQIIELLQNRIDPTPQTGEPTYFERRTPEQSRLSDTLSIDELYRFIRALDSPGYRQANLTYGGFTYFFSNADLNNGELKATVRVEPKEE